MRIDTHTMHRRNVSFQAPSFSLIPPFRKKMESILQEVGLSTLSKRFADEKIDSHVILAMSDSCLMRLGVETLGDRVRLKENCKQFADEERQTNVASTSSVGSSQAQQLIEERRRLFQPYSSRCEKGSGTSKSAKRKSNPTHTDRSICVFSRSTSMQSAVFLGKPDLAAGWPWPKKDQILC